MPHYFDKGFDINEWGDWFGIFFKLFFFGFATFNTAKACWTERAENRVIWAEMKEEEELGLEIDEFQAGNAEVDVDKKEEEECELDENGQCIPKKDRNLGQKISYIFPLGIYIWKCYSTYHSQYLHWNFGYAMGKLISMFVVGVDLWFDLDFFETRNFWWIDYIEI